MSQANPNQEERERITAACIKKLPKEFQEPQSSDLDRLFGKAEDCRKIVRDQMAPMTEFAVTSGKIHTAAGRRDWENTATKLFLDAQTKHQFTRDELAFLLAYTHAKMLLQEVA